MESFAHSPEVDGLEGSRPMTIETDFCLRDLVRERRERDNRKAEGTSVAVATSNVRVKVNTFGTRTRIRMFTFSAFQKVRP